MKNLLITISLSAATLTANAHCGICGTYKKAPSQLKVAKGCCSESGSCCSDKKHLPMARIPVASKKNLAAQSMQLPRLRSLQSPRRRCLATQQTHKEKIDFQQAS